MARDGGVLGWTRPAPDAAEEGEQFRPGEEAEEGEEVHGERECAGAGRGAEDARSNSFRAGAGAGVDVQRGRERGGNIWAEGNLWA